ncbi:pseudouridine synthase [Sphingomicrobium flavum]|uniref:pseudouridine synthase n=1 Tax=Sphingomicrobium flavum TaxID=1229164 RepID=UPI0021AE2249|nr:pseudouridine synthase [Sphingomicrobium flavum]
MTQHKRQKGPRGSRARPGFPKKTRGPKPGPAREDGPQRIAKLLARAGVASRREVERMIEDGRIAIDGVKVGTPATLLESVKGITVDGKPVEKPKATRLYCFYKPNLTLTAERDPSGRKTIYDVMPKGLPRLMPIGRLDFNTEGLLLMTNDGEFKRQMELPSTGVVRCYRARAFGDVTQEQLEALAEGVTIDGMRYGPIDANMERSSGRNKWIEMKLTEGKNREVRNVLAHLGLQVSRLIRTHYGSFELGGLKPGQIGEIDRNDLFHFRKIL